MQQRTIAFLIVPQIHLMDLAGPDQVFLEAIDYGIPLKVEYCGIADNISSSASLPFGRLKGFKKMVLKAGDYLFIPGANVSYLRSAAFKNNKPLFKWLKGLHESGVILCSICTGAFILAESGLLNDKNCTTHWKRTSELKQLYPALQVTENVLFTQCDNIYTSAGVASGIDLALHIVEELKDAITAHKVARELVIYSRRSGHHKQQSELLEFRNHIHNGIHKVQDWLQENLHENNVLPKLASIANMSDRNFTRVFKKETSLTVNAYITLLRKEKISQLINNPNLSRSAIAACCGLKSERQLSRILHHK